MPSGYVTVLDGNQSVGKVKAIGRVCSAHSLKEVILAGYVLDLFWVDL